MQISFVKMEKHTNLLLYTTSRLEALVSIQSATKQHLINDDVGRGLNFSLLLQNKIETPLLKRKINPKGSSHFLRS